VKFIAGFVVALVIMAGAARAIMYTGSYNAAASVPNNPIVEWYLSNTMIHSVTISGATFQAALAKLGC
jgi:hypothetical protein